MNAVETGPEVGESAIPVANSSAHARKDSWLYTPALDLIVGCGAWSAPLLLIGFWLSAGSNNAAAVTFYALALVSNYPHYSATLYRAYRTRADIGKYRMFTIHL